MECLAAKSVILTAVRKVAPGVAASVLVVVLMVVAEAMAAPTP